MKKKNLKVTMLMALLVALLAVGCSSGTDANGGNGSAAAGELDSVRNNLYNYLKEDLIAEEAYAEEDFAEGTIPGTIITSLNKDEEGFADYVGSLGMDPEAVSAILHIQPMMNTKSDNILVIKADDKDAVNEGLDLYHEGQDGIWAYYLPDQYLLVRENIRGEHGDLVYYLTHEKAAELENVILERAE